MPVNGQVLGHVGYIHQNIRLGHNNRQLNQSLKKKKKSPGFLTFLLLLSVLWSKCKVAMAERGHRTNESPNIVWAKACACCFVPALDKGEMWPTKNTYTRSAKRRNRDMGWNGTESNLAPFLLYLSLKSVSACIECIYTQYICIYSI